MIEESLLKSGILGKDGFVWWIGRVAKRDTWFRENLGNAFSGEQGFRCKVRIIGYHPFDDKLKEEDSCIWCFRAKLYFNECDWREGERP